MIRNMWYAVLNSKEVKAGKPVGVERLGEKLVFWRDAEGRVSCIADRCAHRGASLAAGKLVDGHVQCPFHGLEFDGTGKCVFIPANGRVSPVPENFAVISYPVREEHDFIWIFWGDKQEELPELPFFGDIGRGFSYYEVRDPWNCHYSRCIENQLDVVHLPFVHATTIGKGNRTVVNGPRVKTTEDGMNVWVYNEVDRGQVPQKPEETPEPVTGRQHLHFRFPNIWQNFLSDKVRIFISFVPVNEHHTILYMRFYQKFMPAPLLRGLINWFGGVFSTVIAHQDRRVVETQLPDKTGLKMGENLLQGDLPILAYRRGREKLKGTETHGK